MTEEKLGQVFQHFDKDNGGSISANELKEALFKGQDIEDEIWEAVIREVDQDGDGELDLKEFVDMMKNMLEKVGLEESETEEEKENDKDKGKGGKNQGKGKDKGKL